MATISKSSAQMSLTGTCTPQRTNVSNSVSVGSALSTKSFSDANVIYSIKVTATAATDVVSIALATGDATATNGSPTIADSGVDFEGADIGTATKIYAIQVEQLVDGAMAVDGSFTEFNGMAKAGDKALFVYNDGVAVTSDVLLLDLNATGVSASVTVIGKTA